MYKTLHLFDMYGDIKNAHHFCPWYNGNKLHKLLIPDTSFIIELIILYYKITTKSSQYMLVLMRTYKEEFLQIIQYIKQHENVIIRIYEKDMNSVNTLQNICCENVQRNSDLYNLNIIPTSIQHYIQSYNKLEYTHIIYGRLNNLISSRHTITLKYKNIVVLSKCEILYYNMELVELAYYEDIGIDYTTVYTTRRNINQFDKFIQNKLNKANISELVQYKRNKIKYIEKFIKILYEVQEPTALYADLE